MKENLSMNDPVKFKNVGLSVLGAVLGGAVGYFGFMWAARYGFYAMVLPGALLGVGSGWLGRDRCILRAMFCGALAVGLGLFCEWRAHPFTRDQGLGYFLEHIGNLTPVTLLMITLGGVFGGWFGLGKDR
jgi:hypothetical protein